MILSYVKDIKTHPIRGLMASGVAVSISSDDPGFFDYDGVTLDYVYAFMAWDLSLGDLKKLQINSINHSSLDEDEKREVSTMFEKRWKRFIEYLRANF